MTVTKKRSSDELKEFNSHKKPKFEKPDGGNDVKSESENGVKKFPSKFKQFDNKFDKFGKNNKPGAWKGKGNYDHTKKSGGWKDKGSFDQNRKPGAWKDKGAGFDKKSSSEAWKDKGNFDQNAAPTEKTDWKKLKQEKKDLKLKRKQTGKSKDLFELTIQAKQLYEKLKCRTTPNREDLAKELHKLIKGGDNYGKLVLAHDTARVVQCMLKQAPADIKNEIISELIPNIVQMATSKYSRFCVQRMLKYGSNGVRERIINQMMGNVVKLATHSMSSNLIDQSFLTWGTNKQKVMLKQEFYGDLYKKLKDDKIKYISDTWKTSENLKTSILNSVKTHLEHAVNKNLVDNSLIHTLLLEYLQEASEVERNEMIQIFSELISSLCSTRDGSRSSCMIFWHSGNKERRTIMKSIKEHIPKLCTHEHGHVFILTVITTLDDTVALKKVVLDAILKGIEQIIGNKWGRKIIEWIFCPGDKKYFHPYVIASIEEGLKYCKKDVEVKRKEVLEAMEKPICKSIAENTKLWLQGGHTALATIGILRTITTDNRPETYDSVAKIICDPDWMVQPTEENETLDGEPEPAVPPTVDTGKIKKKKKNPFEKEKKTEDKENPVLGIEHAGLHMALKKLIKNDADRLKLEQPTTISSYIVDNLADETLEKWIPLNRPCFLLINILELENAELNGKIKGKLSNFKSLLEEQSHKGAKILQEKIKSL